MRTASRKMAVGAALFAAVGIPALAQAQADRYDALANSPMVENRPTPATAKVLKDELLFQRATQTYLWALPLINTLGMHEGWLGEGVRCRVQRAARVEGATRRQDADPRASKATRSRP